MSSAESTAEKNRASTVVLVYRSISVLLTNLVPIYGVLYLGWNSFGLVFLFIMESVIVLLTDIIKIQFLKKEQKLETPLFIEFCFILFFGFFAILVYGPYESLEHLMADRLQLLKNMIMTKFSIPLLVITFIRLVRCVQEILYSGIIHGQKKRPLHLDGGAWSLFLFIAVIAAPIVARTGPNPTGGLAVFVLLKTGGEIILVWIARKR